MNTKNGNEESLKWLRIFFKLNKIELEKFKNFKKKKKGMQQNKKIIRR